MKSLPLLLLSGLMVLSAAPASGASSLDATLTLSDPSPAAQDVVYSWDVQVNSTFEATSLKVSLPPGTQGDPRLYLVDGLPSGQVQFDGGNLAFHFDQIEFTAGKRLIFAVRGLSNAAFDGPFVSSVVLGDHRATTPEVLLDGKAGTRAMVFVTSQAASLSKQDPSTEGVSSPVLMTNEQQSAFSGRSQSSRAMPTQPWLAAALLASLLLVATKRVICIV